jgi:predicted RND superfamily exporter protein
MLWNKISNLILNNRKIWLFAIVLITALMGYFSSQLQLSYELAKILPESDPAFQRYEDFKKRYGEDGNVMIIAIESDKMYDLDFFNKWYDLNKKIKAVSGVKNVASNASLFEIQRNDSLKRFDVVPLVAVRPATQADVDSIKNKIAQYPFYKGFVYSEEGNAHLMAITLKQADLNSKRRLSISGEIQEIADEFGKVANVDIHYSGMPYIRTNFMSKVRDELIMFMILAFLTTTGILYLFFRSFRVVFFAVLVVLTAVIWSVGFIYLFGYKITILTGMIPPLIMIIGIPNTIFLINKYQEEFLKSKNQLVALGTSIEKIGKTTFIANVTTFIGFFVFYFTGSPFLVEFGLVAALSVMATWAISLILIPIIFSYNPEPNAKHVRHLENKNISRFLEYVNYIVHNQRTKLYWFITILLIVSAYGMTQIKAIGYVVDDLPEDDRIYTDLKFIEKHFHGVVPFEVEVDSRRENGVTDPELLNQIKVMQREFAKYPEFTKPVSIVEAIKFVYQGYRGGDAKYYRLPGALELRKLTDYQGDITGNESAFSSFVDSTRRYTRISFQATDAGTVRMGELIDTLQAKIDTIFNYDRVEGEWLPEEYQVSAELTGNGVVFTKGNNYLLSNLRDSTILAIILVCLVMATQFLNFRTVLISTIPSVIPLIITAGIMGYFGIPLKPSTTLIFSIAFGIASDGTIYFLTKYKEEILSGKTIGEAVTETIRYTGISMFYTAIILFFGFGIFIASGFKGTIFLGLLVSVTLLMSMISNLILLPSFLMTLDKRQTKKELSKSAM